MRGLRVKGKERGRKKNVGGKGRERGAEGGDRGRTRGVRAKFTEEKFT